MIVRVFFIKTNRNGYLIDGIVIVFGFELAIQSVIYTDFYWYQLLLFPLLGIFVFIMSTIISSDLLLTKAALVRNLKIIDFEFIKIVGLHIATALHEEIIWRGVFLVALVNVTNSIIAITVNCILFTCWHRAQLRSRRHALEFLIFSGFICYLFLVFNSLLLVVSLHFFRNIMIEIVNYRSKK